MFNLENIVGQNPDKTTVIPNRNESLVDCVREIEGTTFAMLFSFAEKNREIKDLGGFSLTLGINLPPKFYSKKLYNICCF